MIGSNRLARRKTHETMQCAHVCAEVPHIVPGHNDHTEARVHASTRVFKRTRIHKVEQRLPLPRISSRRGRCKPETQPKVWRKEARGLHSTGPGLRRHSGQCERPRF